MYYQPDLPKVYTAGMAYVCGRCGRHGHNALYCAAPKRFEGFCFTCGQYGHTSRFCAIKRGYGVVRPRRVSGDGVLHAGGARVQTLAEAYAAEEPSRAATPVLQQPLVELEGEIGNGSTGGGDGEDDADEDCNSGVLRQRQQLRQRGGLAEAIDPPGDVSAGGEGGGGGGPNAGTFLQLVVHPFDRGKIIPHYVW